MPILGDIPLIGSTLFSSESESEQEDNLVIILTPYIIDKSENLSKLQQDLGMLSNLQKKYNLEVFKKIKNRENDDEDASQDLDIDE